MYMAIKNKEQVRDSSLELVKLYSNKKRGTLDILIDYHNRCVSNNRQNFLDIIRLDFNHVGPIDSLGDNQNV